MSTFENLRPRLLQSRQVVFLLAGRSPISWTRCLTTRLMLRSSGVRCFKSPRLMVRPPGPGDPGIPQQLSSPRTVPRRVARPEQCDFRRAGMPNNPY